MGKRRRLLRRLLRGILIAALALYALAVLALFGLRWIEPPFTAVHAQRRVESWAAGAEYRKRYTPVPLDRIAGNLQRAVVTAEDSRFWEHRGFDWVEVRSAIEDEIAEGRTRGASTITQQLVKNLFLTTWRSPVRKVAEVPLTVAAEPILGKRRILELYLNVVEWGPGVYGAEAAARHHYGVPAARLTREQAARLAAVLPAPLRRSPGQMNRSADRILDRMGP
jgi:monofunctional glycosyltransferase